LQIIIKFVLLTIRGYKGYLLDLDRYRNHRYYYG